MRVRCIECGNVWDEFGQEPLVTCPKCLREIKALKVENENGE